jgi:hypothetical protein
MSFDKLRTNGKCRLGTNGKGMIPFVVSFSNRERNRFVQRVLGNDPGWWIGSAGARERR